MCVRVFAQFHVLDVCARARARMCVHLCVCEQRYLKIELLSESLSDVLDLYVRQESSTGTGSHGPPNPLWYCVCVCVCVSCVYV